MIGNLLRTLLDQHQGPVPEAQEKDSGPSYVTVPAVGARTLGLWFSSPH